MYAELRSCFFFSSRRRHTRFDCDWSSDVCSSDLDCRRLGPCAGECAASAELTKPWGRESYRSRGTCQPDPASFCLKNRSDRKSTRLNSSHSQISYAVFCLKKKKQKKTHLANTSYI